MDDYEMSLDDHYIYNPSRNNSKLSGGGLLHNMVFDATTKINDTEKEESIDNNGMNEEDEVNDETTGYMANKITTDFNEKTTKASLINQLYSTDNITAKANLNKSAIANNATEEISELIEVSTTTEGYFEPIIDETTTSNFEQELIEEDFDVNPDWTLIKEIFYFNRLPPLPHPFTQESGSTSSSVTSPSQLDLLEQDYNRVLPLKMDWNKKPRRRFKQAVHGRFHLEN